MVTETEETENPEKLAPQVDDIISKHNIITRITMTVFWFVLIWSFVHPLPVGYAEVAAWLTFGAFVLLSVGINSLKLVTDFIGKIKGITK